jgi:hypothetical protein
MAVYDLEEQDQIDELKAWWTRYGGAVTVGLVLAVLVIGGVQGWRWWSGKRAEDASVLYSAVSDAARTKDPAKAKDAITQITDKYAGTAYAPRAALLYAKMLYDSGDRDGAKAQYTWAAEHAKEDEIQAIARFRSHRCRSTRSSTTRRSPHSTRSIRTRSTACSPTCAAMRWQPPAASPTRALPMKRRSRSSIPSRRTGRTCR